MVFGIVRKLIPVKTLLVVLLLFLGWQVWVFTRPRPAALSALEQQAVGKACEAACDALAEALGGGARSVGVAHLGDDPTDEASGILREQLEARPDWTVRRGSVIQAFLADVSKAVARATTLEEVLHAARRVDLDVVVSGRVVSVTGTEDTAEAVLDLWAYDARKGDWLFRRRFTGSVVPSVPGVTNPGWFWRLVAGLAVILGLPWLTPFFTWRALETKTNRAGAMLLAGYTAVDVAVAWLAWGIWFPSRWTPLLLALCVLLCATYSFWVCEAIARRQTR